MRQTLRKKVLMEEYQKVQESKNCQWNNKGHVRPCTNQKEDLFPPFFSVVLCLLRYTHLCTQCSESQEASTALFMLFFKFYFIFKLYNIVLALPYIEMNPPQAYMCSPSWTLLPPPSPYHPSGSSQCTSPKHPVSCIETGDSFHIWYYRGRGWDDLGERHWNMYNILMFF